MARGRARRGVVGDFIRTGVRGGAKEGRGGCESSSGIGALANGCSRDSQLLDEVVIIREWEI